MSEEMKPSAPYLPMIIGAVAFGGAILIGIGLSHPRAAESPITISEPKQISIPANSAVAPPIEANVEVPDVLNIREDQAREAAKSKGLKIDVTTGKSNDIDAGRVISQYPRAGIGIPRGATLRVRISTGSDKIAVVSTPQYRPTPPSAPPPRPTYYWPSPDAPAYTYPLSYNDLYGKSNWELDIMRNTIYARYGRGFNRHDLQSYFNSQSWYHYNPNFRESMLTRTERQNAALIAQYQHS